MNTVLGIPLRCENGIHDPEITWKEGEAGKKGVSYQNVGNIFHIEVIMIPQESACNSSGLVEGRWQNICAGSGGSLDMGTAFAQETQLEVRCLHSAERNEMHTRYFIYCICISDSSA